MRYLIASILCFAICALALSQLGCHPTWQEVTPQAGEFKIYATVLVQDDWCVMEDGSIVNGFIKYNTVVRSVCTICVSLKSDDPERTLAHELDHCWRNANGLDAKARNQ